MTETEAKYIELNSFLRINNIAPTGGKVKLIIRAGNVKVNGETELRNKRKLRGGDIVECLGKNFKIEEDFLR